MRYTRLLFMLTTLIAALSAPATALACGNAMHKPEPIVCVIIITWVVAFFWLLSMVIVLIVKSFVTFDAKKPALILTAAALIAGGAWFTASRLRPEPPTLYRLAEVEHRLSQGARSYFASEQRVGQTEPWHAAGEAPRSPGATVPWPEYVFPGGVGFTYSSARGPGVAPRCADAPVARGALSSGEPARHFTLDPAQPAHALAITTFERLHYRFDTAKEARMLIGYETGPGRGAKATATITVMVNIKPDTPGQPRCHTEQVFLRVNPELQEVEISQTIVTHQHE